MKKVFLTGLFIAAMSVCPNESFGQISPKEWSEHFKQVAGTPEYAGVDAVTLDENGEILFGLEIPLGGEKKEDISKKAKLILKNSLKKYVDEYIIEDELNDSGALMTQATANTRFSNKVAAFINHIKIKFKIGVLAADGHLTVILNDFQSSTSSEIGGQGGGSLDDLKPMIVTGKYAVNKKNTKVLNNIIGYQRVGVIDLKNDIFKVFNEKIKLSVSDLDKEKQW